MINLKDILFDSLMGKIIHWRDDPGEIERVEQR
jgi:hypothetical protein